MSYTKVIIRWNEKQNAKNKTIKRLEKPEEIICIIIVWGRCPSENLRKIFSNFTHLKI